MYEVVVVGLFERTVRAALIDLVDSWCDAPGQQTLRVTDQARLVALINRLHDLGLPIEAVRRVTTP